MGFEFNLGCSSTYVDVDIPLASRIAYGGCVMLLFTKMVYTGMKRDEGHMSLMSLADETVYGHVSVDRSRVLPTLILSFGQMSFMMSSWNYPVLKATALISQLDLEDLGKIMLMSLGLSTIMSNMRRA